MNKLIEWLEKCDCTDIKPVQVTIGVQTFNGAQYVQHGDTRLYLLGVKTWKDNTCFPCDGREWYVAGYINTIRPEFVPFHPFGPNCVLMQWPQGEKIDAWEKTPYLRIPLTIQY